MKQAFLVFSFPCYSLSLLSVVVITTLLSSETFYLDLVTFVYLPTMRTWAKQSYTFQHIKADKDDNESAAHNEDKGKAVSQSLPIKTRMIMNKGKGKAVAPSSGIKRGS